MSGVNPTDKEFAAILATAADWVVRRDRGMSAAESIEFELWIAADPRHAAALRAASQSWTLLDRTPEPFAESQLATAEQGRTRRRTVIVGLLAAAAALALGVSLWTKPASQPVRPAPVLVATGPREVTLADGSLVRLNADTEIVEDFQETERRVRLVHGEAHFTVVHNTARPFIVMAGALRVRAVGTAFNVDLQSARVEVLVTEGTVSVARNTEAEAKSTATLVETGQRALLATTREAGKVVVTQVDSAEMRRKLAWQETLVRLGGATLEEIAQDFERRFGARIVIVDPNLANLRAGGRIRADDAAGFANALATTFDLDVERAADGAWVLRKKDPR